MIELTVRHYNMKTGKYYTAPRSFAPDKIEAVYMDAWVDDDGNTVTADQCTIQMSSGLTALVDDGYHEVISAIRNYKKKENT